MEESKRSDQVKEEGRRGDPRVQMVSRIWAMLIPVLALSIPFCALSRFGILIPFFAIAAAALVTAWVSFGGGGAKGGIAARKENERLHDRIKELEERLANVETISRFEMQLVAREKAALEDSQLSLILKRPNRTAKKRALDVSSVISVSLW